MAITTRELKRMLSDPTVGDGRMRHMVKDVGIGQPHPDISPMNSTTSWVSSRRPIHRYFSLRYLSIQTLLCGRMGMTQAIPNRGKWLGKPLEKAGFEDADS